MTTSRRKERRGQASISTPPARLPSSRSRRTNGAVLVVFAVVFATLEVVAYTQKSATWDEPIHITAGYVALAKGDYRVDPSHPPFLRMWAALPLLALRPAVDTAEIDRTPILDWLTAAYGFAHRFMYVENDADALLYTARFMVVLLGVGLGVLLFCWANEWFGFWPALFALIFYTIEPNLAAHASLVTTDFGATCFIFAAVYFLWRSCRRPTAANIAGLTVFFALAIVTKFGGLLLGPIVLSLLGVALLQRSAVTPKVAGRILGVLAIGTFVAVWAIYGFRYAPAASDTWLLRLHENTTVQQRAPIVASVSGWIDDRHLLPNAFTQGFLFSLGTARQLPGFLMGNYSTEGWWYYFPVALLIKTPIALIALVLGGLFVYVKRRRQLQLANELFVVVPIVIYLGFAMVSQINVGLRHVLPIYPFLLLIAVAAVKELLAAKNLAGRLALGVVTVYWVARFGAVYPHTIGYFNQLVGGPDEGYRYLVDSNLDWGQHLKSLKQWMDSNGVSHVNLAYFGTADPGYYGIDCTYLPGGPTFAQDSIAKPQLPGYVAISETVLSGVYLSPPWRLFYRPFQDRPAVARIGNSIRLYWVERWPDSTGASLQASDAGPADADVRGALANALVELRWYDLAVPHAREYVEQYPDRIEGLMNLGVVLAETGALDEATQVLRRAVDLHPMDGLARRNLAILLLNRRQDVVETTAHAERAVALMPDDSAAHELLGRVLALQGRLDEAAAQFRRALDLDPAHSQARENLSRVLNLKKSRNRQRG